MTNIIENNLRSVRTFRAFIILIDPTLGTDSPINNQCQWFLTGVSLKFASYIWCFFLHAQEIAISVLPKFDVGENTPKISKSTTDSTANHRDSI